jgi:hypothetical protein
MARSPRPLKVRKSVDRGYEAIPKPKLSGNLAAERADNAVHKLFTAAQEEGLKREADLRRAHPKNKRPKADSMFDPIRHPRRPAVAFDRSPRYPAAQCDELLSIGFACGE